MGEQSFDALFALVPQRAAERVTVIYTGAQEPGLPLPVAELGQKHAVAELGIIGGFDDLTLAHVDAHMTGHAEADAGQFRKRHQLAAHRTLIPGALTHGVAVPIQTGRIFEMRGAAHEKVFDKAAAVAAQDILIEIRRVFRQLGRGAVIRIFPAERLLRYCPRS